MKRKPAATAVVMAFLLCTLVGCTDASSNASRPDLDTPTDSASNSAADAGETPWKEVEEPLGLTDTLEGEGYFQMLRPGPSPYQNQLMLRYSQTNSELKELVLAQDGVVALQFIYRGAEVSRYITKAYITDSPKSKKEKAELRCDPAQTESPQSFGCYARFLAPGNAGGTFYGVIETLPLDPDNQRYGSKRTVAAVTVEAFGSEGPLCMDMEGERKCNSLPK